MSDFTVSPEALRTAAAELRSESARMGAVLAGLESELSRLRSGWDGAAQQSYDQTQRNWTKTFERMRSALDRITEGTDQIAEDYVSADKSSAKRFTRRPS